MAYEQVLCRLQYHLVWSRHRQLPGFIDFRLPPVLHRFPYHKVIPFCSRISVSCLFLLIYFSLDFFPFIASLVLAGHLLQDTTNPRIPVLSTNPWIPVVGFSFLFTTSIARRRFPFSLSPPLMTTFVLLLTGGEEDGEHLDDTTCEKINPLSFMHLRPEEIAAIVSDFNKPGSFAIPGLYLGGTKYMVVQGEAGVVILGKKGAGGVTVKKMTMSLTISVNDEPMTPGQCNMIVERLGGIIHEKALLLQLQLR